jgi:hypothetical protein
MLGNIFDIVAMIEENIVHVQHEEKNPNASFISTGATVRYIENPVSAAAPPISAHGSTALAVNGKNDKNTIKNFFNLLISFNYITILPRCDINQNRKCRINVFYTKKFSKLDTTLGLACGIVRGIICAKCGVCPLGNC